MSISGVEVPWATARRDPAGMHVGFDVGGPAPVVRIVVDMHDGTVPVAFNADLGGDYRAFRGLNVKPVINGSFTPTVTATDARGCSARGDAAHSVTVLVGGL